MSRLDHLRRAFAAGDAAERTQFRVIFAVADVTPAETPLPEVDYGTAVDRLVMTSAKRAFPWLGPLGGPPGPTAHRPVEACAHRDDRLVARVRLHPFATAVYLAFDNHRPLVLSPDMLWQLVAQGFANHVNANAEDLRPRFVAHLGKEVIAVRRDDFVKGSPANPWPEVFEEFSRGIRAHIGAATHDLLLPRFSTTGPTEKAAAEVVLMDAMKTYFDFQLSTLCGIPHIVLEGSQQDWRLLAERTRELGRYGLGWWTDTLAPILDEFVRASDGEVNAPFWQSICKVDGGSGGPYFNGWFTTFFPYLRDGDSGRALNLNPWAGAILERPPQTRVPTPRHELNVNRSESDAVSVRNPLLGGDDWVPEAPSYGRGLTADSFPSGLARAPFRWRCLHQAFEMEFLAGFVGVRQDTLSLALRPEIGWAVREAELLDANA